MKFDSTCGASSMNYELELAHANQESTDIPSTVELAKFTLTRGLRSTADGRTDGRGSYCDFLWTLRDDDVVLANIIAVVAF